MNWTRHFVFYQSLELEGNHWWLERAKAKIGSKRAVQFMNFHLVVGIRPDTGEPNPIGVVNATKNMLLGSSFLRNSLFDRPK